METDIILGDEYVDKITGFRGVAVGMTFWLHACERAGLQWTKLGKDGKVPEIEWFDAPGLVHVETKAWQCMRCGRKGGWTDFMAQMAEHRTRALRGLPLQRLAENRCVSEPTLRAFGVGWDQGEGLYTVPVRDATGAVTNIHRYRVDQKPFGTVGGRNTLFLADPAELAAAETVWVCEGEWDAMALWEALRATGSPEAVVGVAGAKSASEDVAQAAQGKHALLAFDHDDPGPSPDAATRERLRGRALSVRSVHWPGKNKPGYDVRDLWTEHGWRARSFLRALRSYLKETPVVAEVPDAPRSPKVMARAAETEMQGEGVPRDDVVRAYKKWMHLPDPEVIDVMFGAVLANRLEGDPLWLFIVGPPGCGKSMLLMSLVDAPLCTSRTTVTRAALVSGQRTGRDDPSLLPKLDGRVLVIKDFTTVLKRQEADREEIFGVLRDAYDGRCTFEFHGLLREYVTSFGMVVGVTAEIEKLGSSHSLAGERFVKYYMHRRHGRVRAGHQAAKRALRNRPKHAQMREELEAAAKAALTRHAPTEPALPEREEDRILGMAAWTAALRGAVARDR
ncbi:hypothetical protein LCGC14_2192760, partial [marine sediment metagenome]